jgi:5-methylcytosine-specific restriction enzyme subunit McrC
MNVDVVHAVDRVPRLVFDAKYKAADARSLYSNADHYQMLAYCTALSVPRAWLVYARGGPARVRRVVNTDITIVEHPLDLRAEPQDLLAQVDALARDAWRYALGSIQ